MNHIAASRLTPQTWNLNLNPDANRHRVIVSIGGDILHVIITLDQAVDMAAPCGLAVADRGASTRTPIDLGHTPFIHPALVSEIEEMDHA